MESTEIMGISQSLVTPEADFGGLFACIGVDRRI
jgi:hypothetical protein